MISPHSLADLGSGIDDVLSTNNSNDSNRYEGSCDRATNIADHNDIDADGEEVLEEETEEER